jgi:hypothetical protein
MSFDKNTIKRPDIKVRPDMTKIPWDFWGLIILYLIALLVSGLNEFVSAGFDVDVLFTGEWWWDVFRTITTNLLVLFGTLAYFLKKAWEEEPTIRDRQKEVQALVDAHLDPITFDPFLPKFNRKRKIEAYKRAMSNKLDKLEKKYYKKSVSLELWAEWENTPRKTKELKDRFETDKYCQEKHLILQQLTKEYIDKNIDKIELDYKPIQKTFVANGYVSSRMSKYDDYAVESGSNKMLRDLSPRIFLMFGWLIALNSVAINAIQQETRLIGLIVFLFTMLPLIIQIFIAQDYTDKFIKEKILVDFQKRKDIMINYLAYLKEGKEVNDGNTRQ